MFVYLLLAQWAAAVGAALWLSPQTWDGARSSIHPHVWWAVAMGGLAYSLPALLAWKLPGRAVTRYAISVAQVSFSGLLIQDEM
jgi:hypothetical protein